MRRGLEAVRCGLSADSGRTPHPPRPTVSDGKGMGEPSKNPICFALTVERAGMQWGADRLPR